MVKSGCQVFIMYYYGASTYYYLLVFTVIYCVVCRPRVLPALHSPSQPRQT